MGRCVTDGLDFFVDTGAYRLGVALAATDPGLEFVTSTETTSGGKRLRVLPATPRGVVAFAQITASSSAVSAITDVTGLSVTPTLVAGRRYRTTVVAQVFGTVAADLTSLSIGDAGGTALAIARWTVPATNGYGTLTFAYIEVAVSSGGVTRKVRAQRNAGTGTINVQAASTDPAFIIVEDIGV